MNSEKSGSISAKERLATLSKGPVTTRTTTTRHHRPTARRRDARPQIRGRAVKTEKHRKILVSL
jgi:hypothetical protein